MDFKFSIFFGKSPSSDYDQAVDYASRFELFTPEGMDSNLNIVETTNHEVLAKYQIFQKLVYTIGSWKSAGVSFRNQEVDSVSFYLNTKDIAECYQDYLEAENKAAYCNDGTPNCWGCRHLKGITLQHMQAAYNLQTRYWYQFGKFIDKNTWGINKEEISLVLTDLANKNSLEFCPVFEYSFFRKLIAELPSYIDVTDTEHWGQVYTDVLNDNVKQWKAANVFHKITPAFTLDDIEPLDSAASKPAKKKADDKSLRQIPETTFADVGGIDDIIKNIREVIELPIKKPELYDHLGIRPYRGILLWGEPGNGKTLVAKAIAHEVNAHFIPVVGPDILNKNFGESEKNLRDIFEEAMELQPSIIFLDELDAIAQSRLAGETAKWYATVVNQLLGLMDGIKEFGNVTVIASTNRPDLLDPALLRPGRFDYKLEIKRPNLPGCKKILEIATRGMPLSKDVDLFSFAESVVGYSAAEITFIAKEAALVALRRCIDVTAVIKKDNYEPDFSKLVVVRSDFADALTILKKNSRYTNKTYSLKG